MAWDPVRQYQEWDAQLTGNLVSSLCRMRRDVQPYIDSHDDLCAYLMRRVDWEYAKEMVPAPIAEAFYMHLHEIGWRRGAYGEARKSPPPRPASGPPQQQWTNTAATAQAAGQAPGSSQSHPEPSRQQNPVTAAPGGNPVVRSRQSSADPGARNLSGSGSQQQQTQPYGAVANPEEQIDPDEEQALVEAEQNAIWESSRQHKQPGGPPASNPPPAAAPRPRGNYGSLYNPAPPTYHTTALPVAQPQAAPRTRGPWSVDQPEGVYYPGVQSPQVADPPGNQPAQQAVQSPVPEMSPPPGLDPAAGVNAAAARLRKVQIAGQPPASNPATEASRNPDPEDSDSDPSPLLAEPPSSLALRGMKNYPNCPIPPYKRGADADIDAWIFQMETYFVASMIPEAARVSIMACRIHLQHFNEVKPHTQKAYPYFRKALREIFRNPDMTQARLMELAEVKQKREEDYQSYMDRIRALVIKIYPKMSMQDRDKLTTTHFVSGLQNQQIAIHLAGKAALTPAKAINKAAAMAAFLHETPRSRKPDKEKKSDFAAIAAAQGSSRQHSRPGSADSTLPDDLPEAGRHPERSQSESGNSRAESDEDFFGAIEPRQPYSRRFKTSANSGKCFRCGRFGHRIADCRVPDSSLNKGREQVHDPPTARGMAKCPMCEGPHYMERCPTLARASQLLADMRQQNRPPNAGVPLPAGREDQPVSRSEHPVADRTARSSSSGFGPPRAPPLPGNPGTAAARTPSRSKSPVRVRGAVLLSPFSLQQPRSHARER